jgi:hypothetical protein
MNQGNTSIRPSDMNVRTRSSKTILYNQATRENRVALEKTIMEGLLRSVT